MKIRGEQIFEKNGAFEKKCLLCSSMVDFNVLCAESLQREINIL